MLISYSSEKGQTVNTFPAFISPVFHGSLSFISVMVLCSLLSVCSGDHVDYMFMCKCTIKKKIRMTDHSLEEV